MTPRCQDIGKMLQSLAQDASANVARAIKDVANEFIISGGYGSARMHAVVDEKITKVFRSTVNAMTKQARRGGSGDELRVLVDTHLSHLIEQTIDMRAEQMGTGKMSSEDSSIFCTYLHRDLKRLKDAAVRTLRPEL
jgi:hypothetical protein